MRISFEESVTLLYNLFSASVTTSRTIFARRIDYRDLISNDMSIHEVRTENGIDITLSQSDFEKLCFVLRNAYTTDLYSSESIFRSDADIAFTIALEKLRDEEKLRNNNPTLKKLWGKYQTAKALINDSNCNV